MLGSLFERFRVPGLIQPFHHEEKAIGLTLTVKTSPRYTTIVVNGVEFFFRRENGKYDGVGSTSTNPHVTRDWLEAHTPQ